MNISIVLPVYHEEKNIPTTLKRINQYVRNSYEVLIIYDSDDDPTVSVVRKNFNKNNIHLVKNSIGIGRGVINAIKTGILHAKGEAVVILMADLSDDISQIDQMYNLIKKGFDIVCASRYMKGGRKIGGPIIKTLLSKVAGLSLYYLFKVPTHDSTNAFKMYRWDIFNTITIASTGGFEYSLEIIIKAYKKGYKITEIPTIWKDREEGKSNFRILRWLPKYIGCYLMVFQSRNSPSYPTVFFVLILLYSLAIGLKLFELGSQIRSGIYISSTLDFSWISDSIERLLHGYVAGKDFIFTYGPLFQSIAAFPSLVFHVPSYVSVALLPLTITLMLCLLITVYSFLLVKDTKKRILLVAYLLFFVQMISHEPLHNTLRIFSPLVFSLIWYKFLYNAKYISISFFLITLLPSILGLYSYDLFAQTMMIVLGFSFFNILYNFIKDRHISRLPLFAVGLLFFWHILVSLIFSGNLSYIRYSLDTLNNYYFIMDIPWTWGRSSLLFIFPLSMLGVVLYLKKLQEIPKEQKILFFILVLTAFFQLRGAITRSDQGHILFATYPSIIVLFSVLYVLLWKKKFLAFAVAFILLPFLPFNSSYYQYVSQKNIQAVIELVKNPPQFLSLYRLPDNYSFTEKEILELKPYLQQPEKTYIYPYDSYMLNAFQNTYNSFPLQSYAYSNSPTEEKAVIMLTQRKPKYIILGIDGKTSLALDEIPNFIRNPLIGKWIIQNYQVEKQTSRFLLLRYSKGQAEKNLPDCKEYVLTFNPGLSQTLIDRVVEKLVKSSTYYISNTKTGNTFRLPYKDTLTTYPIMEKQELFFTSQPQSSTIAVSDIKILRKRPFAKEKEILDNKANAVSVSCMK